MITKVPYSTHEEWLSTRHYYIGGSDAAAVVGLNKFCSPLALWAEKTDKAAPFDGNLATEVGAYLEEFVAKKFEKETGKKVRRKNFSLINDLYPWAIANIDREIIGEDAGLEIKTTSALNLKRFKNGEYPENYYVQCVHYMAVTGKKKWYLAVLIGNSDFRIFEIERDEEEITALMEAEKDFWKFVVDKTPPPADGYESTTRALSAVYPESEDVSVDLTMVRLAIEDYKALSERIKEMEELKEARANEIKSVMGDAAEGISGEYRVTWKSQARRTFDRKAFEAENGEIPDKYYKHTENRVFKIAG